MKTLGAGPGEEAHGHAQGQADQTGEDLDDPEGHGQVRQAKHEPVLLKIGKAKKLAPTPATPQAKKSPIVGTYWWRNVTQIDYAWDNRALYFVDGASGLQRLPGGRAARDVHDAAGKPEDEFDTREGCLPYTFDEQTGAVTIGDKAGTFAGGKLTIDGEEYFPLQVPAAGARFAFNDHRHFSFSGMCGMIFGCTIERSTCRWPRTASSSGRSSR